MIRFQPVVVCIGHAGRFGSRVSGGCRVFVRDVADGLLEVSHNALALLGLAGVAGVLFLASRADLRHSIETHALDWLRARHAGPVADVLPASGETVALQALSEPDAIARATATDPRELNRQQAAVAQWLSRRYRVAPEPISRLVKEAWLVGGKVGLDPTLILAIMAIESSFNPFAQSPVGAQGLMQVMTRVHDDKYTAFGGILAAFDPVTNLRVGVQVLKECIARAGSLEAGLRSYVGAGNVSVDGGYAGKVLAEQSHLQQIASGKQVALNAVSGGPTVALSGAVGAKPLAAPAAGDTEPASPAGGHHPAATAPSLHAPHAPHAPHGEPDSPAAPAVDDTARVEKVALR